MYSSIPQEIMTHLHYSRRLLLTHESHSPPTPIEAPAPTYQVLDPSSSHNKAGFDANIIMILAVLVSALICSLCINTLIRCVIKCSSILRGEPNYYLNMISDHNNDKKAKIGGVDKRALKTFPVVKFSKEVKVQGLGTECVICLSEFKVGEKIRVLPKCNHGFHVKCIDEWLSSHSSCPTCRHSLVETCQKIIGCGGDHHQATSSSSPPSSSPAAATTTTTDVATRTTTTTTAASSSEVVAISIVPLEREDLMRNYRGD